MKNTGGAVAKFVRMSLFSAIALAPAVSAAEGVSLASCLIDFNS